MRAMIGPVVTFFPLNETMLSVPTTSVVSSSTPNHFIVAIDSSLGCQLKGIRAGKHAGHDRPGGDLFSA